MKYSYAWLKELSGTKKTPEKAVEELTFHSFEVEGIDPHTNIAIENKSEIKNKAIGVGVKNDTIIEIKVLPDRAHDAMSHVGVAREMAVLEGRRMDYDFEGLKLSEVETRFIASKKVAKKQKGSGQRPEPAQLPKIKNTENKLQIKIEDKNLCPRYIGAVMNNITIKDSPDWMKKRLEASGMRAINNVVDATNYVMLELGQPLHAFDFFKIKSEFPISKSQFPIKSKIQNPNDQKVGIVVRKAKNGEKIELLDSVVKELSSDDLLITDGENPLAIAGIKGGKLAEIDENTKTVILEAANFNAVNIRRTRTKLNLKTDSSDRFEKDIDPNLAEKAMARLIEIIEHTAGGKVEQIVDVYSKPVKPWKIKLDLNYVNDLLGEDINNKKVVKILNLLGIETQGGSTSAGRKNSKRSNLGIVQCIVPTHRIDLKTQEDLIEEIGRIYGYEKVKEQPIIAEVLPAKINEQVFFERKIQDILTGIGFDEVCNYSFYSEKDKEVCGLNDIKHFELANPMNPDQKFVRVSLAPNILKNVHENLKNFEKFGIFEIGRVYFPNNNKVEEKRMLAMATVKNKNNKNEIFFDLKGAVEDMLEALGVNNSQFCIFNLSQNNSKDAKNYAVQVGDLNLQYLGRSAEIKIGGEKIGIISEINPAVLTDYKIKSPVAMAEFDLEILKKYASELKVYKPISKFPKVTRDISLVITNETTYDQIIKLIKKTGGNLVQDIKLFDVFSKDGKKSLAFHIEFGADDRTLESKEIDEVIKKIISELEKELKIEIRK